MRDKRHRKVNDRRMQEEYNLNQDRFPLHKIPKYLLFCNHKGVHPVMFLLFLHLAGG
jgi:hypothetical protein